jgi:hypothetical protein
MTVKCRNALFLILLDPVPELLVQFHHLDEILQPLMEFRWAGTRSIHIGYADALVGA